MKESTVIGPRATEDARYRMQDRIVDGQYTTDKELNQKTAIKKR